MCGILVSLSTRAPPTRPSSAVHELLRRRGPDSLQEHSVTLQINNSTLHAYFLTTVLSLRGSNIVAQPLVDSASGSVLCWNGEAWSIHNEIVAENDTSKVFASLLTASLANREAPANGKDQIDATLSLLSSIQGPYALVFYDSLNARLYFGRDCLGRRSMVCHSDTAGELTISSLIDSEASSPFHEVEADGFRVIDLSKSATEFDIQHIPYLQAEQGRYVKQYMSLPFGLLNKTLPVIDDSPALAVTSSSVRDLERLLRRSLSSRVRKINPGSSSQRDSGACHLAILFSGGLDCSVIARMTHDLLDESETIDLLNVAFYNPRIHKSAVPGVDFAQTSYELCPDRITGRATFAELRRVCPNRTWRFVAIDVPYDETVAHRDLVMSLMHPHNTEMDLSISYALYFASRGVGTAHDSSGLTNSNYATPARVLLSGLGADELFGGYQRHAIAFSRLGFPGLLEELDLDINRLGKRNLGRDDRIISHWSKEARFPYLDENIVSWALRVPIWQKCGFGLTADPSADRPALEPGKLVLRLLAGKLGMPRVAAERKRAIQFGARTAKMENNKAKGTHVLS